MTKNRSGKNWLDNLGEYIVIFFAGFVGLGLGYLLWQWYQNGTRGVIFINFIPIPLIIFPGIAFLGGAFAIIAGFFGSIGTLFRAIIKGDKRYIKSEN